MAGGVLRSLHILLLTHLECFGKASYEGSLKEDHRKCLVSLTTLGLDECQKGLLVNQVLIAMNILYLFLLKKLLDHTAVLTINLGIDREPTQ